MSIVDNSNSCNIDSDRGHRSDTGHSMDTGKVFALAGTGIDIPAFAGSVYDNGRFHIMKKYFSGHIEKGTHKSAFSDPSRFSIL